MPKNPWTGVDALEADELSRIQGFYVDALTQALKNQKTFLQKVKDVDEGKIKPPYPPEQTEKIKKWREGFVREQLRQQAVIDGIMKDINKAGEMAAGTISDTSVDIYSAARDVQAETLKNEAETWLNKTPNFAIYNKRQIGVLLQKEQSPFSKIAYQNLGQNEAIRRRLQNEMAIAIINGESQQKMMKRIRDVVGNAEYNARRTAQTERTRIQAQATHETATEAHAMGIRTYKKWSTRMINSRDNHIALNGAVALTNELFKFYPDGSEVPYPMMYPGDSSAPASEVCNCHCVYIEHVLLDDEDVKGGKIVHIDPAVGKRIAEQSIGFSAFNEEMLQRLFGSGKETAKLKQAMLDDSMIFGTNKKKKQQLCDFLNGVESADPSCNELFTHMDEWSQDLNAPVKVTYTGDGHAVSSKAYYSGRLAEVTIKIPKLDGDIAEQCQTTVHEYTHFLNLTRGVKKRGVYAHQTDTTGVIEQARNGFTGIPDKLKKIFAEKDKASREAYDRVYASYRPQIDDVAAQISDAITRHDYTEYERLKKVRNKLYSERDLKADYASREAMGGYGELEDIIDAITQGDARDSGQVRYGHGKKYYRNRSNADNETLSNYCGIMMCYPDVAKVMKEELPEICDGMHKIVEDMLGGV